MGRAHAAKTKNRNASALMTAVASFCPVDEITLDLGSSAPVSTVWEFPLDGVRLDSAISLAVSMPMSSSIPMRVVEMHGLRRAEMVLTCGSMSSLQRSSNAMAFLETHGTE